MTEDQHELPTGWEWTTLGQLAHRVHYGHTTKADFNLNGPRFLRITDIQDGKVDWTSVPGCECTDREYENYKLNPGDIVIARSGSVGRAFLFENGPDAVFASYLIRFCLDSSINLRYASYYLNSPFYWSQIQEGATGSTLQNVNANTLSAIQLPLAPIEEQDRIVEKIERLFGKIEAGQAQLDKLPRLLKQFRQTVLAAACSGRLVPQDPNDEPASELLRRIQEDRRARWEIDLIAKGKDPQRAKYPELEPIDTTDLPELPDGWAWTSLGELSSFITSGSRGWAQYYSEQGALFVRAQNIGIDHLVFDDVAFVTPPAGSEGERTRLRNNDLLVVITGATTGRIGRFTGTEEAYVNQHVALVRPVMEELAPYLELALKDTASSQRYIQQVSYGLKKGLNLTQVASCPIPLPPIAEQQRILEKVNTLLSVISTYWERSHLLMKESGQLKQTVLSKAFRGELVEQDPADEPASVLLERIQAQKSGEEISKPKRQKAKEMADTAK